MEVGALFPLSGVLQDKGVDSANGVRVPPEEANAAKGIAALDGVMLEIIYANYQMQTRYRSHPNGTLYQQDGRCCHYLP